MRRCLQGCPGFAALICLQSGIWSDFMFVFHYASSTNPFCWKSSFVPRVCPLPVWLMDPGAWVEAVPSWGQRWLGHTGLSCGGRTHHLTGGKQSHKYYQGAAQSAYSSIILAHTHTVCAHTLSAHVNKKGIHNTKGEICYREILKLGCKQFLTFFFIDVWYKRLIFVLFFLTHHTVCISCRLYKTYYTIICL